MNPFKPTPIENNGQRVLTTAQLAEAYGTDPKIISYNFNHNSSRYIEGKHFYRLTGEELKAFREIHELPKNLNTLYLWTERGSLLHAKSLNTDTAWEAYDYLLEYYFRTRELSISNSELLELYNNINYSIKVFEKKIYVLEHKIDSLEKKSGEIADKAVQDTVDTLVPCFNLSDQKADFLNNKVDVLEKKIDVLDKKSGSTAKEISKKLNLLDRKIRSAVNTSERASEKIIKTVTENTKSLAVYFETFIKMFK